MQDSLLRLPTVRYNSIMKAYRHTEDGQKWLRIITQDEEWDEPISGWELVLDMRDGKAYYRHKDGREAESV